LSQIKGENGPKVKKKKKGQPHREVKLKTQAKRVHPKRISRKPIKVKKGKKM